MTAPRPFTPEAPADLPTHYGRTKVTTIIRDFNRLRVAIRSHDTAAIEAAWLNCERWLDFVFGVAGWREKEKG